MDLALNNLQRLICHKPNKPNQTLCSLCVTLCFHIYMQNKIFWKCVQNLSAFAALWSDKWIVYIKCSHAFSDCKLLLKWLGQNYLPVLKNAKYIYSYIYWMYFMETTYGYISCVSSWTLVIQLNTFMITTQL